MTGQNDLNNEKNEPKVLSASLSDLWQSARFSRDIQSAIGANISRVCPETKNKKTKVNRKKFFKKRSC